MSKRPKVPDTENESEEEEKEFWKVMESVAAEIDAEQEKENGLK